jgi:lipopolysaccharide biosynthesis glycosyltransferase
LTDRTLQLACASGEDYAPHVATMVHSALEHRDGLELHVHYLHPGVRAATLERLAGMVAAAGARFDAHELGAARLEGLPDMADRGITRTMWLRIFLPELLPEVERVLYLDADVIVVDSLAPLWATDLGDACLGAVTNVFEPWWRGYAERLGVDPDVYFNSGVLLFDLARMRREGITEELLAVTRADADGAINSDQDALNVVLSTRRHALHPRWNAMNSVLHFDEAVDAFGAEAVEQARSRPAIRHFEGPAENKPWHPRCAYADRELYLRHRAQTPWPKLPRVRPSLKDLWRRLRT